jgi:hypothetical protein
MSLIYLKRTIMATHVDFTLYANVKELNFIAAAIEIGVFCPSIMFLAHLEPPQPVPRKITAGAENSRFIG